MYNQKVVGSCGGPGSLPPAGFAGPFTPPGLLVISPIRCSNVRIKIWFPVEDSLMFAIQDL